MKRSLILLSVATAVALMGVTAPALSSLPYQPAPVEAEVAAPADGLGEARERGFVSEPVEAPMRFNMVGLNWNGGAEPGIALRVRKDGAAWSDWTTVPPQTDGAPDPQSDEGGTEAVSAPVWAGEADQVQYRVSRRPPDLRLHFINTTGTATAADRVETTLRGVVNEATVAVAGLASAEADDTAPAMMSRAEWSGGQCDPAGSPSMGKVKAAFIHHTVTANDYSRAQAPSMVLGICRYHRYSNGWDDIGYQFLVDKYGRLYEGRAGGIGRPVIGAQVQGFNDQSTGIANLGTHSSVRQSRRALRATARLLRWKLPHHGATTGGSVRLTSRGGSMNPYPNGQKVKLKRISGHRDAQYNECPGSALYGQLKRLRRMSDVKPPRAPEGFRAKAERRAVKLDWRRNTEKDLDGYSVYRKRAGGTWKQVADVRRSEFRHEGGRRPGRTLSYHVRAFDDRGNLSRPSREATVTVPRR